MLTTPSPTLGGLAGWQSLERFSPSDGSIFVLSFSFSFLFYYYFNFLILETKIYIRRLSPSTVTSKILKFLLGVFFERAFERLCENFLL